MQALAFLEVSDRGEMDGTSGLHARLLLKMVDQDKVFSLVGTAVLNDQIEIATIEVIENALNLSTRDATALLNAGFESCWNDIVLGGCAASGFNWRPIVPWLKEHLEVGTLSIVASRVLSAMS